jgi:hypothetical protein
MYMKKFYFNFFETSKWIVRVPDCSHLFVFHFSPALKVHMCCRHVVFYLHAIKSSFYTCVTSQPLTDAWMKIPVRKDEGVETYKIYNFKVSTEGYRRTEAHRRAVRGDELAHRRHLQGAHPGNGCPRCMRATTQQRYPHQAPAATTKPEEL